jgi:hypothetical protein
MRIGLARLHELDVHALDPPIATALAKVQAACCRIEQLPAIDQGGDHPGSSPRCIGPAASFCLSVGRSMWQRSKRCAQSRSRTLNRCVRLSCVRRWQG